MLRKLLLCATWPYWAYLPHCERASIPVTKELSQENILLLTLLSMLGPSACSNPDPINGHTRGSISQALGCQMWYGITMAGWCKGAWPDWGFKAFGPPHQLKPFKSRFRLVRGDMRGKRWGGPIHLSALFVLLAQSSLIDRLLLTEFEAWWSFLKYVGDSYAF